MGLFLRDPTIPLVILLPFFSDGGRGRMRKTQPGASDGRGGQAEPRFQLAVCLRAPATRYVARTNSRCVRRRRGANPHWGWRHEGSIGQHDRNLTQKYITFI
jgi:hypothetical protein